MTIQYDPQEPLEIPNEMYQIASRIGLGVVGVSIQGDDGVLFACLMRSVPQKGETIMLEDGGMHLVEAVHYRIGKMSGYSYAEPLVIARPFESDVGEGTP